MHFSVNLSTDLFTLAYSSSISSVVETGRCFEPFPHAGNDLVRYELSVSFKTENFKYKKLTSIENTGKFSTIEQFVIDFSAFYPFPILQNIQCEIFFQQTKNQQSTTISSLANTLDDN